MKIKLVVIGKTNFSYISEGIVTYEKRLKNYISVETIVIPELKNAKNLTFSQQKEKEGELILKHINPSEAIILLDERGAEFSSVDFSNFIQQKMNSGIKTIHFIIGGSYGFSEKIYQKANKKIALSKMTFSHQMVRLFFMEQLYRAMTILKGEPYHHN